MTYSAHPHRPLVLKARGETIALIVCVTVATFALANTVHSHRPVRQGLSNQQWTGALTDLSAEPIVATDAETITSASLVVPKSELALPPMPVRALVKLRGCERAACGSRRPDSTNSGGASQQRPAAVASAESDASLLPPESVPIRGKAIPPRAKTNLMSRLNPLNYVPGMTVIKRPFASAGETVTGWFRRF